jgi:predicted DNA-binding transcriptional regulator AlpA
VSERLLRTRDVAELLDVSCETVLRWHRSGKLPGGRRLGTNVLRFDVTVQLWLDECSTSGQIDTGARTT